MDTPPREPCIKDREMPLHIRGTISGALRLMAVRHAQERDDIVRILIDVLRGYESEDPFFTGLLTMQLVYLQATEAAEVIERGFAAGCIDDGVMGGWEEIRVLLGVSGMGVIPEERPARVEHVPDQSTGRSPKPKKKKKKRTKNVRLKNKKKSPPAGQN